MSLSYIYTICSENKKVIEQTTVAIIEQNRKINLNVSLAFLTSPSPNAEPTKVDTDM